ncbi:hypothetical protein [Guptibacillus sedimenti]|uniref:hypothetical protein n=1 Tax=Guptibacillus sedimenti TaxID=3025680 RepID=UPI002360B711|nr:hypothetical protein [Pseudalkalibacillus sedimenti]
MTEGLEAAAGSMKSGSGRLGPTSAGGISFEHANRLAPYSREFLNNSAKWLISITATLKSKQK